MNLKYQLKISIYPLEDHRYESNSDLAKEFRGTRDNKYKIKLIRILPLPKFEVAETYTPTGRTKYYLKEHKELHIIGNCVQYEIIHSEEVQVAKKIVRNGITHVILKNNLKKL